jgi:hypothetical protein
MMVLETRLLRKLPPFSPRASLLLAGSGLLLAMMGIFTGAALLAPAACSFLLGLGSALRGAREVMNGRAYVPEGNTVLLAATVLNGTFSLYAGIAGAILLYFGV